MKDLERWHGRARRKPLVVRGARQVGKTTLVRLFAERLFEGIAEVNFERDPQLASLFAPNDPAATLERFEVWRSILPDSYVSLRPESLSIGARATGYARRHPPRGVFGLPRYPIRRCG